MQYFVCYKVNKTFIIEMRNKILLLKFTDKFTESDTISIYNFITLRL